MNKVCWLVEVHPSPNASFTHGWLDIHIYSVLLSISHYFSSFYTGIFLQKSLMFLFACLSVIESFICLGALFQSLAACHISVIFTCWCSSFWSFVQVPTLTFVVVNFLGQILTDFWSSWFGQECTSLELNIYLNI